MTHLIFSVFKSVHLELFSAPQQGYNRQDGEMPNVTPVRGVTEGFPFQNNPRFERRGEPGGAAVLTARPQTFLWTCWNLKT